MKSDSLVPLAIAALFAWRIYSRVRRNIGRQPFQQGSLIWRVVIFSVIAAGMVAYSVIHPAMILGTASGLVLGAVLALVGLNLTRFEAGPGGRYYTPNPYFGAGLSVLLVGRVAYRLYVLSNLTPDSPQTPGLLQSPLSMCVLGLLAGYYIAYFSGVLLRGRAAVV